MFSQAFFTRIQGGDPLVGFAAGSLSSVMSSLWQGGEHITNNGKEMVNGIGGANPGTVGTMFFGTISGGAGAAISGGNFWQGAVTGLVVSGLNHTLHDAFDGDPPMKNSNDKKINVIGSETPIQNPDGSLNSEAYNCHSYAWHGGKGDPLDPANSDLVTAGVTKWDQDPFKDTGGYKMIPFSAKNQVGDRVVYYAWDAKAGRVSATHSAVVSEVNSSGQAVKLTSKFGQGPLATHHPRNIPSSYGSTNPTYVAPNGKTYQSRIYFRKK